MKKARRVTSDDLRPEYDFASMKGGVRGKYVQQYKAGTNLVLLDPDLAETFPNDTAVNETLRAAVRMASVVGRSGREAGKRVPPAGRARRRSPKRRSRPARG